MYVGAARSGDLGPAIKALDLQRVIFNPGSENPKLAEELEGYGLEIVEACTLVMLTTGHYARL